MVWNKFRVNNMFEHVNFEHVIAGWESIQNLNFCLTEIQM